MKKISHNFTKKQKTTNKSLSKENSLQSDLEFQLKTSSSTLYTLTTTVSNVFNKKDERYLMFNKYLLSTKVQV